MKKIAAAALILTLLFTLTGCSTVSEIFSYSLKGAETISKMFTYWKGMSKSEVKNYICEKLEEKYGEEFTVIETYKTGSGELVADCSPKADGDIVFDVKVYAYSETWREVYDNYIETIVSREMRYVIEDGLSKHCKNFSAEVWSKSVHHSDSGIRSASEATFNNYAKALPEEGWLIWIGFDKDEFGGDYGKSEEYLLEFIEEFQQIHHCVIDCYFVSSDIIEECQDHVKNHTDIDLNIILSSHRPSYAYCYYGSSNNLVLQKIYE